MALLAIVSWRRHYRAFCQRFVGLVQRFVAGSKWGLLFAAARVCWASRNWFELIYVVIAMLVKINFRFFDNKFWWNNFSSNKSNINESVRVFLLILAHTHMPFLFSIIYYSYIYISQQMMLRFFKRLMIWIWNFISLSIHTQLNKFVLLLFLFSLFDYIHSNSQD